MRSRRRCIALLFPAIGLSGFLHCTQVDLSEALNNNLCSDDFNRADSDRVGGNWDVQINFPIVQPPEIKIVNGRAWFNLPFGGASRLTMISCKNRVEAVKSRVSVDIETSQTLTASHQIALYVRMQDFYNSYACLYTGGKIVLGRVASGSAAVQFTSSATFSINQGIPAKFSVLTENQTLSCKFEQGVNSYDIQATDSTYSAGKVGLYANSATAAFDFFADNLKVEILQ